MSRYHLACTADARYAPFCAAMLHSFLSKHRGADWTVHYLHPPELEPAIAAAIERLVRDGGANVRLHAIPDPSVAGLPPMRGIERVVWYRCFLPELAHDADRILYLDADTLVMDDLVPLWDVDLAAHPLAAVPNVMSPDMRASLAALGLPVGPQYFNSGVMLANLALWRREAATASLLEIGRRESARIIFGDQDALNFLFQDRALALPPRWNSQTSFVFWNAHARALLGDGPVAEALDRPAILHFEGPPQFKPWHYLYPFRNRRLYWSHLRATGLPLPQVEGRTPRNILYKHTRWIPQPVRRALRRLVPLR